MTVVMTVLRKYLFLIDNTLGRYGIIVRLCNSSAAWSALLL